MCCAASAATPPIGLLTVLEGQAQLLRGAEILSAARGIALEEGDVIETGESGFAQLEFSADLLLAVGSASRVVVFDLPGSSPRKARPHVVLLRGWVKIEANPAMPREPLRVSSHHLLAQCGRAALVMRVDAAGTQVFVESGAATLTPIGAGQRSVNLAPGQLANNPPGLAVVILPKPSAGFLTEMPRAFRDTLPPAAAQIANRTVVPERLRDASYDDAADLLTLPRPWRSGLVQRFGSRVRDKEFRAALDANMRRHPEWDRVLHPEKYLPPAEAGQASGGLSAKEGTTR